jgi:hypothetical protein
MHPNRASPALGQVHVLTGKDVERLAGNCQTATDRACLAVDLCGAILDRLTARQAIMHAGAGSTYTRRLRALSPLEQAAVKSGRLSLSHVHHYRKLDDTKLAKLITDIGIERVWRILDKLTAPVTPVVMVAAE